ncbi:MAG: bacterial regulatory helix-turn-helix, lysR family protein [Collimonas fungivorans]|uniref:LysR substrate-binding domain-containing protein n=1 Tax=Collimonas fungivorans TaxID=158899 RepID=UPI0026EC0AB8|nr:LysR substrate-binding domain-containing protein [Collimonas fungivorans]MDB5768248.1 bacterial regulatory helix-turn-helix, lysR family protein [Collimonas fungivorans]
MKKLTIDLNDLYFFVQVVDRGGFTAAADALDIPKSRLSRRTAELEKVLGVRLLHRTSRRIALTEVGSQFYQHCVAMIIEAHAAEDVVQRTLVEPVGVMRFSAPEGMIDLILSDLLPRFMAMYPKVQVMTQITNRNVDLIEERIDVALRINSQALENSSLVQTNLCSTPWGLYASPSFIERAGQPQCPADLASLDALVFGMEEEAPTWRLLNQAGEQQAVTLKPRMRSDNIRLLKKAALAHMGVIALPRHACSEDLAQKSLQRVLPDWHPPSGQVRLVFPTRRGLVPAVRAYIEFLKAELPARIALLSGNN